MSTAVLPAQEVPLHQTVKVRLGRLNELAVIRDVVPVLLISQIEGPCATDNDTAIIPGDEVVIHGRPITDAVGEGQEGSHAIFGHLYTAADASYGDNAALEQRCNA
jgi:hypothetical protein